MADDILSFLDDLDRQFPSKKKTKRSTLTPLTPDEESQALDEVGRSSPGWLQYIGETLDKPGRAMRGLLTGHPGELANLIPFSDTIGLTNPEQSISGRDMLEQYGVLGENERGLDVGDVAGFGAELLTDPMSWIGVGAIGKGTGAASKVLGKAGLANKVSKAAKAAGKGERAFGMGASIRSLLPTLAPVETEALDLALQASKKGKLADLTAGASNFIDEPLNGLVSFHPPFSEPLATFGHGDISQKIAGVTDKLGEKLRWSTPGRHAANLFDPKVRGWGADRAWQEKAIEISEEIPSKRAEALGGAFKSVKALDDLSQAIDLRTGSAGFGQQVLDDLLQISIEPQKGGSGPEFAKMLQHRNDLRAMLDPAELKVLDDTVSGMHGQVMGQWGLRDLSGLYSPELQDDVSGYAPRFLRDYMGQKGGLLGGKGGRRIDTTFESTLARKEIFKNIPGGRYIINSMMKDPELVGKSKVALPDAVARLSGQYAIGDAKQAEGLARFLQSVPNEAFGKPLYGNPVRDYAHYVVNTAESRVVGEKLLEFVAHNAVPKNTFPGEVEDLDKVLLKHNFRDSLKKEVVNPEALNKLANLGIDPSTHAIPKDFAKQLDRVLTGFRTPDALAPIVEGYDKVLTFLKKSLTAPWPAYHSRNLVSGMWQNFVSGAFNGKTQADAFKWVMTGQAPASLHALPAVKAILQQRGLPDSEAASVLQELIFSHEVLSRYHGQSNENIRDVMEGVADRIPGRKPVGPKDVGNKLRQGKLFEAGADAAYVIESGNRVSGYIELLKQGFDPAEAASRIKLAHVDYSGKNFTPFERSVMTRLVPFYKFTARNLPFTLRMLRDAPGGKTAQAIRAAKDMQKGDYLPEYLNQTLSIPYGEEDASGNQRFLTGFGLPHEDALGYFNVGNSPTQTVGNIASELAGRTTPLVKVPIELATGKQLHSGRDLDELDPSLGRLIGNIRGLATGTPSEPVRVPGGTLTEELFQNSPIGRVVSTARQITDPRKAPVNMDNILALGTNLLSGAKFSDVDMNKQRSISVRELLGDVLEENPAVRSFEHLYVPPEKLGQLSEQELLLLNLYRTEGAKAAKKARDEKKRRAASF